MAERRVALPPVRQEEHDLIKDRPQTTRAAEPPELRDAVAKAKEFAALAEAENNPKQKAFYDRMSRKWQGIADGYRFIVEIAEHR